MMCSLQRGGCNLDAEFSSRVFPSTPLTTCSTVVSENAASPVSTSASLSSSISTISSLSPAPSVVLPRQQSLQHLALLGDNFWEFRKTQEHTDLAVSCQGEELPRAHAIIVAAAAPTLAALFRGSAGQRRLELWDAEAASVEAMLQFLYTGSLPDEVDLVGVLRLSHECGVDPLTAHCATLLRDGLTKENAVEIGGALVICLSNEVARQAYETAVQLSARGRLRSKPQAPKSFDALLQVA